MPPHSGDRAGHANQCVPKGAGFRHGEGRARVREEAGEREEEGVG